MRRAIPLEQSTIAMRLHAQTVRSSVLSSAVQYLAVAVMLTGPSSWTHPPLLALDNSPLALSATSAVRLAGIPSRAVVYQKTEVYRRSVAASAAMVSLKMAKIVTAEVQMVVVATTAAMPPLAGFGLELSATIAMKDAVGAANLLRQVQSVVVAVAVAIQKRPVRGLMGTVQQMRRQRMVVAVETASNVQVVNVQAAISNAGP